jgi:Amt family ammonium transporter
MPKAQGLFYGGGFKLLGIQLLGLLIIGVWTAVTMFITFTAIKATVGLRVTEEEEVTGLDKLEHGMESAYAGFTFDSELVNGAAEEPVDLPVTHVNLDSAVETKVYSEGKITKVVIITKPERFAKLKEALDKIGIAGMTSSQVMGCGIQRGRTNYYRGAKVDLQLLPKLKCEVVVSEIPVDDVINAAKKALYTGHMGDGKIFVYAVEDVVRISSGAQGKEALAYK